jgi:nitrate/nitrite-specific signal transduction histidine kinase
MDLGDAYIHLGYQIIVLLVIGTLIAAMISALLAKLQKNITVPLVSLAEAMRKVSKDGDFPARTNLSNQDEIGELANVFNQMIDEL